MRQGERERQRHSRAMAEGGNLCWCVSKNAVRECQAIKEYDELYAKKTTTIYIHIYIFFFCTKKLKNPQNVFNSHSNNNNKTSKIT